LPRCAVGGNIDAMRSLPDPIAFTLERFRAALEARYGKRLREVVLFGSWARGEADEESDVDVLVVIDDLTDEERRAIVDMAYVVDSDNPELLVLSPLCYSTSQANELRARERRLLRDIDREGISA
jgi:predicted nucleotidyltransferase